MPPLRGFFVNKFRKFYEGWKISDKTEQKCVNMFFLSILHCKECDNKKDLTL